MSFYALSKLGWLIAQPVTACLLLIVAGLIALPYAPRTARWAASLGVLALIVMNFSPLGRLMIEPLESRFPPPAADAPPPYGFIVLGGAIEDDLTRQHGQVALNEAGARLTETALLARRYPNAKIFYTGGTADLFNEDSTDSKEAEQARDLLVGLGVLRERIGIETQSRNTDENARFSAAILMPQPGQIWWLVTSAYHMPRSMGLFRKAGFNVVAYPVDYRSYGDRRDYTSEWIRLRELNLFDISLHEWVGLASYYFAGKIDHLFPAP